MNSIATLLMTYALFTLISSGILFASFRKKLDESAVYFLISELSMAVTCVILFLQNTDLIQTNPLWLGASNFTALCAELAILISILSLTKKVGRKKVFFGFFLLALFAAVMETLRGHLPTQAIVLMYMFCTTALFVMNFYVCRFTLPPVLTGNQFMRMFTWFELGMVAYGIMRILGSFTATPVVPRDNPGSLALIIFAFYVVMGAFRYLSYIGLRITWVDPKKPVQNQLNAPLLRVIEEKDSLLRGLIVSNRVIGISALASSLAHQLSQPLTAIALEADTAKRALSKLPENAVLTESLNTIGTESTKLTELVKSLRQIFSSRHNEFQSVNLQKMVDDIIEIIQPTLAAKKITLTKIYQSNPMIYGDAIQIQQVLINVFNNAVDSIENNQVSHKHIKLLMTQTPDFASLTIENSGSGIPAHLLPTIFELYQTTKQNGLGVGLWLSKTIVERHHGTIRAFNSAKGGAAFEIQIPLSKAIEG